ncbi:MAG: glycosyltransferase [Parahaliea sp.]
MRAMPNDSPRAAPAASLSVSLVLYNSDLELVRNTLASLHRAVQVAQRSGRLGTASLCVIDNATPGDYGERAQALLGTFGELAPRYERLAANAGFGAGHNRVIAAAKSDFHLVLNPDVEFAAGALDQALASFVARPEVVLMAPSVRGDDGQSESLCKRHPSLLVLVVRARGLAFLRRLCRRQLDHYEMRELSAAQDLVEVPLASGCCMLARSGALRAVGGFDERFFMYFEDFDLSLRIAAQGVVVFNPAMRIVHHGGFAASKGWRHVRMFCRSAAHFFNRYGWRLL